MSQQNVELIQGVLAAFEGQDLVSFMRQTEPEQMRALLETVYDPEVEIVWVDTSPDAGPYHGHNGVLQAFNVWLESFDEFSFAPTEFIDAGDEVVVVASHDGRGKGSGAQVEMTVFWVMEVKDGKIARWREYATRAGALEAAGLSADSS